MAELHDLDVTDANNNGPAVDAGFAEGMEPGDVNDASRALEGMLARWLADNDGSLQSNGSGNNFTLAPNRTITAYFDGLDFLFTANHTITDAQVTSTINVSGLGAQAIKFPDGRNPEPGDIVAGGRYKVSYDGTNFQLIGADEDIKQVQFYKTADTVRSATTTLADDDHLINIGPIKSGKFYVLEWRLHLQNSSNGFGFKCRMDWSTLPVEAVTRLATNRTAAASQESINSVGSGDILFDTPIANIEHVIEGSTLVRGAIGVSTILNFQWAQPAAQGTSTLKAGSYVKLTQLGDP